LLQNKEVAALAVHVGNPLCEVCVEKSKGVAHIFGHDEPLVVHKVDELLRRVPRLLVVSRLFLCGDTYDAPAEIRACSSQYLQVEALRIRLNVVHDRKHAWIALISPWYVR